MHAAILKNKTEELSHLWRSRHHSDFVKVVHLSSLYTPTTLAIDRTRAARPQSPQLQRNSIKELKNETWATCGCFVTTFSILLDTSSHSFSLIEPPRTTLYNICSILICEFCNTIKWVSASPPSVQQTPHYIGEGHEMTTFVTCYTYIGCMEKMGVQPSVKTWMQGNEINFQEHREQLHHLWWWPYGWGCSNCQPNQSLWMKQKKRTSKKESIWLYFIS